MAHPSRYPPDCPCPEPIKKGDFVVALVDQAINTGQNPVRAGFIERAERVFSDTLHFKDDGKGTYKKENWRKANGYEIHHYMMEISTQTSTQKTYDIMEKGKITDDLIGAWVSCYINGTFVSRARIQKYCANYYICQNDIAGDKCPDRFGFSYSWNAGFGNKEQANKQGVTKMNLLPESYYLVGGRGSVPVSKSVGLPEPGPEPYRDATPVKSSPEKKFKLDESLFKPERVPHLNQFN